MFNCEVCNFKTDKKCNYLAHLATVKHLDNCNLFKLCTQSSPVNNLTDDHDHDHDDGGTCTATDTCLNDHGLSVSDYFPFENRLHLLLYVLRGSKYHHIDQELFKFILHILRVVQEDRGVKIPPFHKIWNQQVEGLELKPVMSTTKSGQELFYVKPSDLIELQLSKQSISSQLQRYPKHSVYTSDQTTGEKWKNHMPALMAKNKFQEKLYVGDSVKWSNGMDVMEKGIIKHFYMKDDNDDDDDDDDDDEEEEIQASVQACLECDDQRTINKSCWDLIRESEPNVYHGADIPRVMNLIEKSKQLNVDLYTVPVNLFVDDTSANRSKKWSPLNIWTLQLSGLSTEEKMKKSSHHLIGCTRNQTESLARPVVEDLNDLYFDGKLMFDASLNTEVLITSQIGLGIMDNQMASEFCHHMGPAAKEFCRFCRFQSVPLSIGERRVKERTEEIVKELEMDINNRKETGTLYGIKKKSYAEEMNKAVEWDPHRDIPPDILHSRYLGDISILLKCTIQDCTDLQKENLQLALDEAEWNGFNHRCGPTFIRYHKSCQGKDYRAFVQLAPFIVQRAGLDQNLVKLWCLLSELILLVNKRQMSEGDIARLGDLQLEFNTKMYEQYPETAKKQKLHQNLHTEEQIKLHGVPVGYTTEAGESWCGIVKNIQFITNHHNPNRDTIQKLARIEEITHVAEKGTWLLNDQRVSAAPLAITELNHPRVQSFVFGNIPVAESENGIGKCDPTTGEEIYHPKLVTEYNKLKGVLTYYQFGIKRKNTDNETIASGSNWSKKIKKDDIVSYKVDSQLKLGKVISLDNLQLNVKQLQETQDSQLFKCKRFAITSASRTVQIHKEDVVDLEYAVHDCHTGGCCAMLNEDNKRTFRHNKSHHVYLINRFKINQSNSKY